jgi:hypothetical protein
MVTPPTDTQQSQGQEEKAYTAILYNARPTWLELTHKKLDEAVFATCGWPRDLSDEEILERLLVLNLERTGEQPLVTKGYCEPQNHE